MVEESKQDTRYTDAPATWAERLISFLVMAAVLAVDQFTKYLIETRLPLYEVWAPIPVIEPFFRILHATNTGMAFGLFQGGGAIIAVVAVVVSGVIIYFNHTLPGNERLLRVALGLQLGGVLGNLIDRVRQGHVTDFLDFGPWPIFNIADTALVVGVILLAYVMLTEGRRAAAE
jgi:signal peptidase II